MHFGEDLDNLRRVRPMLWHQGYQAVGLVNEGKQTTLDHLLTSFGAQAFIYLWACYT